MRRIKSQETKSLPITKQMVWKSYQTVKGNGGSGGVDQVSLQDYEQDLSNHLYKLWNRLSSGSYYPPAVLEVSIPKTDGKRRKLGIPMMVSYYTFTQFNLGMFFLVLSPAICNI